MHVRRTSSFRASSSKTSFKQSRENEQTIQSFSKRPNCEVCRRPRAPCKMNPDDRADRISIAERFWDMITADRRVLDDEQEPRLHPEYAVVVQDWGTQWIQSYPCKTKSAQESQRNLRHFTPPEENPRSTYTDNSLGFIEVCEELSWNHERDLLRADPKRMELQKSSTTSERRHFVSAGSVRTSRKLVGRSHGVLLLSSKCATLTGRWPDAS